MEAQQVEVMAGTVADAIRLRLIAHAAPNAYNALIHAYTTQMADALLAFCQAAPPIDANRYADVFDGVAKAREMYLMAGFAVPTIGAARSSTEPSAPADPGA